MAGRSRTRSAGSLRSEKKLCQTAWTKSIESNWVRNVFGRCPRTMIRTSSSNGARNSRIAVLFTRPGSRDQIGNVRLLVASRPPRTAALDPTSRRELADAPGTARSVASVVHGPGRSQVTCPTSGDADCFISSRQHVLIN